MSVLLTSVKKKDGKDGKTKRKSSSSSSLGSGGGSPPTSNSVTSVWYWKLNGVLTTLMYSRDTSEVWCNGYTLESTYRSDANYGNMTEFTIYLDDKGTSHHGQLLRDPTGSPVLYIDGFQIQKYNG